MKYLMIDNFYIFNSIDELVPNDHVLKTIENDIDWTFIYSLYKGPEEGEMNDQWIDTVILFKIILIDFIFHICRMNHTCKEIEVNVAYRWFLGIKLDEKAPSFSMFVYNYQKQFTKIETMIEVLHQILTTLDEEEIIDLSKIIARNHLLINSNINTDKLNEALLGYLKGMNQEIEAYHKSN